jgi:hypothetical protein
LELGLRLAVVGFSDSAGDGSVLGEIPALARENAGVRDDARFGEGLAGMVPMCRKENLE